MVILDDGSLRYYTVRRAQEYRHFPDNYQFYGSWTENMRQIGNAVPVKLANIIGESVIKQMEKKGISDARRQQSGLKAI